MFKSKERRVEFPGKPDAFFAVLHKFEIVRGKHPMFNAEPRASLVGATACRCTRAGHL